MAGGALAALALAPPARVRALIEEVARGRLAGGGGRFLSAVELGTLRAATARLLPGPPEDPGPGALQVHAAEAIDLMLGALDLDPPLIHAGGPFSGRAGGSRDDFAHFVPLDAQAQLGWRIRLEGSRGLPEREFAGPVVGRQEVYRSGLARLDRLSRRQTGRGFAQAPGDVQDRLLGSRDAIVARFVQAAVADGLQALCGPPEYGGNHDLAGWRGLGWRGDAEPDGYTPAQVSEPDPPTGIVADVRPAATRTSSGPGTSTAPPAATAVPLDSAFADPARRRVLAQVAPLLLRGRRGRALGTGVRTGAP